MRGVKFRGSDNVVAKKSVVASSLVIAHDNNHVWAIYSGDGLAGNQ